MYAISVMVKRLRNEGSADKHSKDKGEVMSGVSKSQTKQVYRT